MRIGFDAKRAFNNTSGLGNYSRLVIQLLAEHFPGNQYLLYTPAVNGSLDFRLPPGSQVKKPSSFIGKHCGTCWRTISLSGILARDGVELYHGLSHDLPYGMSNSRVKRVVTIHDMIPFRHPRMFSAPDRFIYRRKIAHSCKIANAIIAISRQTRDDILEFLDVEPSSIKLVYQTCDRLFYRRAEESFKNRVRHKYGLPADFILSVGTIEPRKNLPSVIRALHLGGIDAMLVVVGKKTGYIKTVSETIHSSGRENVLFLENVPTDELAALYQMASLFVYPSFYEGFGIPVLEALSSGTPVITSQGSCFSETGGPDTRYVDPHNNEELAATISRVLSDTGLRQRMVEGGLRHAAGFRHELIAERIMDVYKSIM
jgi:glycosyltransferase involved in cell wall biosynthesis